MKTLSDSAMTFRAWLLPIAAERPCGHDARYEPPYERVRAELAKLEAVGAGPVAWDAVRVAADQLLREHCKDVFVAAALTRALHVEQGVAGLVEGLRLVARLLAEFGDQLHPARPRARASALTWLIEHSARSLSEPTNEPIDANLLHVLAGAFGEFAEAVRSSLGESAPSLSPIRDALARLQLSIPVRVPVETGPGISAAADAAPPPGVPSSGATASLRPPGETRPADLRVRAAAVEPLPAATSPLASDRGEPTFPRAPDAPARVEHALAYLSDVSAALSDTALLMWRADRSSPIAYRLMRTALWLHLEGPPAHGEDGKTAIPAPDDALRERLDTMAQHGAWDELLETAESTLPSARFWLDLHWYCDRALAALGPAFAQARALAADGFLALVIRMPGLPALLFSDGSPLARPHTLSWIRELTSRRSAEPASHTEESARALDGAVAMSELRSALHAGDLAATVARIETRRGSCGSARARFELDLELARALGERNPPLAALALFQALDAQASVHALDVWEPSLALALWSSYLRCLKTVESTDELHLTVIRTLRTKIAALSPAALVSLVD